MLLCQVALWAVRDHPKALVLLSHDWLRFGLFFLFRYFWYCMVLFHSLRFRLVWWLWAKARWESCAALMSSLFLWLVLHHINADNCYSFDMALFLIDLGTTTVFTTSCWLGCFQTFTGPILANYSCSTSAAFRLISRCWELNRLDTQSFIYCLYWHEYRIASFSLRSLFAEFRNCIKFVLRRDLLASGHYSLQTSGR